MLAGEIAGKWCLSCRASVEKDTDCGNHQLIDILREFGIRHALGFLIIIHKPSASLYGAIDPLLADLQPGSPVDIDPRVYRQRFERRSITRADKAARQILRAVKMNERRALIVPDAYGYDLMTRLIPWAYQPLMTAFVRRTLESPTPLILALSCKLEDAAVTPPLL